MTSTNALQRCVRGKTQNPDKSLHNVILRLGPKTKYVGNITITNAVCMAICQFSAGSSFSHALCGVSRNLPIKKDTRRIKKAEKASGEKAYAKRKKLKYCKVTKEKQNKMKEGKTYKPGSFI